MDTFQNFGFTGNNTTSGFTIDDLLNVTKDINLDSVS